MKLFIEKTKTMFIRLWNELLIWLEYFIRAPFIEIHSLIKGIIKFGSKSHLNGSVTIFYILAIFFMIKTKTDITNGTFTGLKGLLYFIIIFLAFVWASTSLPDWKEYYKKKYFKK